MKILGGRYLTEDELFEAGVPTVGKGVRVHSTAVLVDLERMSFGSNVRIDPYCVISAAGGFVRFGSYIHIAAQAVMMGGEGIEMQDFSGISQSVCVYSVSDDYSGETLTNPTVPRHLLKVKRGTVTLGRHVIVGSHSVVLPGANIAEGCAVGALSLVNEPLAPWGIYAGTPARRLKDRSRNLLHTERQLSAESGA
ncbi:galactoside O-acetyltransferase [Microvirga lupini]|uniref:Galactoside O-acetyltransferase n=1 Tax=Microvirga lupini TaxID=420324 RepID=A0A7W4VPT2_9HYPH|nr:acyltransferase [Microvirga lupini]MBB3020657.1 galactoside O-acetyltransferase [Microvirga lupini]